MTSTVHRLPWFAKIAGKVVLTKLPVSYERWASLGVFKHGAMVDPGYAIDVLAAHMNRLGRSDLAGLTVLELGPGDSVVTAQVARAFDAERVFLVDVGPFASRESSPYRAASDELERRGLARQGDTFTEALGGNTYLTDGLASLRSLPDESVDVVVSQAVLEHIRHGEFGATMDELRRVTKQDGVHSHVVDLRDHLADSLNNLRFSQKTWESNVMSGSGFYTNRIRYREMLNIFDRAGFQSSPVVESEWSALPLRRRRLRPEFRSLDDSDLLVRTFSVVLT